MTRDPFGAALLEIEALKGILVKRDREISRLKDKLASSWRAMPPEEDRLFCALCGTLYETVYEVLTCGQRHKDAERWRRKAL